MESLKLILPSKIHELRLIIDTVAKKRGVLLRPDIEFDSLDAAKILLKSPLQYFSILPFFSVLEEVENESLSHYAIDDPDMSRMISVATPVKPRNHAMTTYLQRHIEGRASSIGAHLTTMFGPSSGF
jgi:hypothetical protein